VKRCADYGQLTPEQRKSERVPPMVLVVTQRGTLDGLLDRAKPYAAFMHFAFYREIIADPFGRVIRTVGGTLGAFAKPTD
jgi:hypothetical protein